MSTCRLNKHKDCFRRKTLPSISTNNYLTFSYFFDDGQIIQHLVKLISKSNTISIRSQGVMTTAIGCLCCREEAERKRREEQRKLEAESPARPTPGT